jgi:hypothetical protein
VTLSGRAQRSTVILTVGFLVASCVLVAALLLLVLPQRFGTSDTFDLRVVGVCAVLGIFLLIGGALGVRAPFLQGAVPAVLLLVIYGKKLSDRKAIADMWALTLIYPVLPALLIAAFVSPWLGRKLRRSRERA